jgi:MFS family permease
VTFGLRKVETRKVIYQEGNISETLSEGLDFFKNIASFRYLMLVIIGIAIADTILEFRFFLVTDSVFINQAAYQIFFSIYRLAVTILAILLQTLVTSRLIQSIQLKNSFSILPVIVILASIGMTLLPGISMAVFGMASVKLIRDTINESSRKSFQGLVPEERRGRVSTLMESHFPAVGTMLACVLAGVIVYSGLLLDFDTKYIYMSLAGLSGGIALWAALRLRAVYDTSLFSWQLKRRQRKSASSLLDKL